MVNLLKFCTLKHKKSPSSDQVTVKTRWGQAGHMYLPICSGACWGALTPPKHKECYVTNVYMLLYVPRKGLVPI